MFLGDGANVADVFDLPLVLHHPHGDGILADLRGDVALNLKSQISEHQVPWEHENTDGWRGGGGGVGDTPCPGGVEPVAMPSKSESTRMGLR